MCVFAFTLKAQIKIISGGNVGIGTSTPSALLSVGSSNQFQVISTGHARTISGNATAPSFSFTSETNTGLFLASTNQLGFSTNGVERFRVNAYGYIGIGTTSPQTKIHILHNGASMNMEGTNSTYMQFYPAGYGSGRKGYFGYGTAGSSTMTISNEYTNGHLILSTNGTGKVGIGTATPSAKLDVAGSVKIPVANTTDNNSPGIILTAGDDFSYNSKYLNQIGFGFHRPQYSSYDGSYIAGFGGVDIFTWGQLRLSVLGNGNVLIGADSYESTVAKVNIYAATENAVALWTKVNHTSDWNKAVVSDVNRANSTTYVVRYNDADKFYVRGDGLACSAAGFYNWSDLNKKKDIATIENALQKVLNLRGVTYRFKNEVLALNADENTYISQAEKPLEIGVIAQEIELVVPEVVRNMHDGTKAVAYQNLVGLLIEAIKEQQTQIQTLQQSVNDCCENTKTGKLMNPETGKTGDGMDFNTNSVTNTTTAQACRLYQNNPNPFTAKTEIGFEIVSEVANAKILVFDMQGALLKTYTITERGKSSLSIYGGELKPGMYLYSLVADNKEVDTKKMILTE